MSWHHVDIVILMSILYDPHLDGLVDLSLVHIVQHHAEPLAGEDHGPAFADKARSHNTNFLIFILSHVR